MRRYVQKCSVCSLQGWTKSSCPECDGFGEYWMPRNRYSYGFVPIDASRSLGCHNIPGHSHKMTDRDREMVRGLLDRGWSDAEIGREMGLSKDQVRKGTQGMRRSSPVKISLSDEQVEEIRQARLEGSTWRDLAALYGVGITALQDYMSRRNRNG